VFNEHLYIIHIVNVLKISVTVQYLSVTKAAKRSDNIYQDEE